MSSSPPCRAANEALSSADRATRRLTNLVRLLVAKGVISEAELEQVVQEVDAQVEVDLALSPPPLTDALEKLADSRAHGPGRASTWSSYHGVLGPPTPAGEREWSSMAAPPWHRPRRSFLEAAKRGPARLLASVNSGPKSLDSPSPAPYLGAKGQPGPRGRHEPVRTGAFRQESRAVYLVHAAVETRAPNEPKQ